MTSFEKASLWVVKIGLWLLPFLPLYVSGSMLFPFITGKNFAFRIATEILFAIWGGLAVSRAEYRPRATPLFKMITAFVGIVFLADLFSPHPYRSFFSNYERMEGFMMVAHMYGYYIMLVSVFKTRRDWMIFFHASLAASIIASYWGLLQKLGYRVSIQGGFRVDATIGNPTYFAAYLLFHIWLLGILMYEYGKVWWRAALYAAILVFELAIIYFTATRGVVLALALATPPFLAALVYFWRHISASPSGRWSIGRRIAAALLVVSLAVPLLFWSIRKTEWVQASHALRRLSNYSLTESTIQDRLLIWKMSVKGVAERPILGWGQENYYLVFQKYFEPGLYGAEQWFDRSHNVFLDWAVHTGLLGLGTYLGILGVAVWQIIRVMRGATLEVRSAEGGTAVAKGDRLLTGYHGTLFFTGLVLLGLFATDFFQKLFVFDNFTSYFLFFAFLAYSEYVSAPSPSQARGWARRGDGATVLRPRATHAGPVAAACLLGIMAVWGWWANVRPLRQSRDLIRTLTLVRAQADTASVASAFRGVLAWRSFGDTEAREQLGALARDIAGNTQGPPEERKRFVDIALSELRKETGHSAPDVKHLLFILSILNRGLALDPAYGVQAEAVAQQALRLSPTKQAVYFEAAQFYLNQNKIAEAADLMERAWRLEPRFQHAGQYAWTLAVYAKKPALAADVRRVLPPEVFADAALVAIARAYQETGDLASATELYAVLVKKVPANAQYRATYAALLANAGKRREARAEVEEAIRLDPAFEKEGKEFLQTIR